MVAVHNLVETSPHDILLRNLRHLMHKANITEAELSRQTNIPQPTLHKILAGTTADPRISTLTALAAYFGISVDELHSHYYAFNPKVKTKLQAVPIISWEDCIKGNTYIDNLLPGDWPNWLITEQAATHSYALISRTCMAPKFPKNTRLIINPEITPMDGDYVIVHYDGTAGATIRELMVDGPHQLLRSVGGQTTPDPVNSNTHIIGVLVESRFCFRE